MFKKTINGLKNPVMWLLFIVMYFVVAVTQHKLGLSKLISKGQSSIDGEESLFSRINPFD